MKQISELLFEVEKEIKKGNIAEGDAIRSFYEKLHAAYGELYITLKR